jgi:hypothetical protein
MGSKLRSDRHGQPCFDLCAGDLSTNVYTGTYIVLYKVSNASKNQCVASLKKSRFELIRGSPGAGLFPFQ